MTYSRDVLSLVLLPNWYFYPLYESIRNFEAVYVYMVSGESRRSFDKRGRPSELKLFKPPVSTPSTVYFYPLTLSRFITSDRSVFSFWTVHFWISGADIQDRPLSSRSLLVVWTAQFDSWPSSFSRLDRSVKPPRTICFDPIPSTLELTLSNVGLPIGEIVFLRFEGIKEFTNTNGVCFWLELLKCKIYT